MFYVGNILDGFRLNFVLFAHTKSCGANLIFICMTDRSDRSVVLTLYEAEINFIKFLRSAYRTKCI
jgi:hypothetical protein